MENIKHETLEEMYRRMLNEPGFEGLKWATEQEEDAIDNLAEYGYDEGE